MHQRRRFLLGWLFALLAALLLAAVGVVPTVAGLLAARAPSGPPAEVIAAAHVLPPAQPAPAPLAHTPHPVVAPVPTVEEAALASGLVNTEDIRLRIVLRHALELLSPQVITTVGSLPTLVLTPSILPYTLADLQALGAVRAQRSSQDLLVENVFVAPHARLQIAGLRQLLLSSGPAGFTSIVGWNGEITLGSRTGPRLSIESWNPLTDQPDTNQWDGRAYLRAVGASMTLTRVAVSQLGFWSGRTGGVAWTGVDQQPSSGTVVASSFTGNVYGGFTSHASALTFTRDEFVANDRDGLRIHRLSHGVLVRASAALGNGGDGFAVSRGADHTTLVDDLAQGNGQYGIGIDSRPLASGPEPSGESTQPSSDNVVSDSTMTGNARTGLLVEGGTGLVLHANTVCAAGTAIALRYGAIGAVIDDNTVRCGGREGVDVGPGVSDTAVYRNAIEHTRIGLMLRDVSHVTASANTISHASVFGISLRGRAGSVLVSDNVISGHGDRPIDTRYATDALHVTSNDTRGWSHRGYASVVDYLVYHPLVLVWLGILALVLMGGTLSRLRRRQGHHPYQTTTSWPGTAGPHALAGVGATGRPTGLTGQNGHDSNGAHAPTGSSEQPADRLETAATAASDPETIRELLSTLQAVSRELARQNGATAQNGRATTTLREGPAKPSKVVRLPDTPPSPRPRSGRVTLPSQRGEDAITDTLTDAP